MCIVLFLIDLHCWERESFSWVSCVTICFGWHASNKRPLPKLFLRVVLRSNISHWDQKQACLLLVIKEVDPPSLVFLGCNTNHHMHNIYLDSLHHLLGTWRTRESMQTSCSCCLLYHQHQSPLSPTQESSVLSISTKQYQYNLVTFK